LKRRLKIGKKKKKEKEGRQTLVQVYHAMPESTALNGKSSTGAEATWGLKQ